MSKAKPISLYPLSFEDALKALVRVDPDRVGLGHKGRKHSRKRKPITRPNPKSK
jgi:hypothetical protein